MTKAQIMTQKDAIDILKLGHNVFLTGPPGSGKTFLLNEYIAYLKKYHKGVAVTASTGIAATHMDGITIHSWTGIGIKEQLSKHDILKLLRKPYLKKGFRNTNVLIIDEISMLHNFQFDMINTVCQSFKNSGRPFGGMQVVCSGDFFQLPPVPKQGEAKFVTESEIWQEMDIKICYLNEQHRQKDDKLTALLNYIRDNSYEESRELLLNRKPEQNSSLIAPIKLYTHNIDVDTINNFHLDKISGTKFVYRMKIYGNQKIAASLGRNCLASEKLELKIGAKVMFVKNNFDCGYVNGTLGEVIGFSKENMPVVKTYKGAQILAEPCKWKIEENYTIKAEVEQIPLRLAWAITVHKSQGMNLDAAEIDLSKCFLPGMGYVALSRLSEFSGLKLKGINDLALLVNEDALKLDKEFKGKSRQANEHINKMKDAEKEKEQKRFLSSLPRADGSKARKKEKKEFVPTHLKTGNLVAQKMSIKEIAKRRGLSEEAIISHLEKLAESGKYIDLGYLKPEKYRFEKIKIAFEKSGAWLLTPAREILGNDFSYQEMRIARLFLTKTLK